MGQGKDLGLQLPARLCRGWARREWCRARRPCPRLLGLPEPQPSTGQLFARSRQARHMSLWPSIGWPGHCLRLSPWRCPESGAGKCGAVGHKARGPGVSRGRWLICLLRAVVKSRLPDIGWADGPSRHGDAAVATSSRIRPQLSSQRDLTLIAGTLGFPYCSAPPRRPPRVLRLRSVGAQEGQGHRAEVLQQGGHVCALRCLDGHVEGEATSQRGVDRGETRAHCPHRIGVADLVPP